MRIEILIILVTGFFIINSYHDNYYLNIFKSNKKYFQMVFYGFI
jgi:hypothetical protein